MNRRLFVLAIVAAALAALSLHARHYLPFLSDDALISLRYVDRLLDGRGLTWTDGRPVEGYSNLLWMLLVAGMGWLGADLIDAARGLGFAGMAIAILSLARWYGIKNRETSPVSLALGLFFFSTAAPTAVWTIGGLEQPLLAALLAVMIPLIFQVVESDKPGARRALWLSFVLGLICLARPDGPIFTVAALVSIALARRAPGRDWSLRHHLLLVATVPILLTLGQTLFRLGYYGEALPNTAWVKIAPSAHHLIRGVKYVAEGVVALAPFSLLALAFMIGCVRSPRARSRALPLLVVASLWALYLILIGGDLFPAHRQFVPLVIVGSFAVVEGAEVALRWLRSSSWAPRRVLAIGVIGASSILFVFVQFSTPANRKAIEERWEWDGQVLGLLLKRAFSDEQPLLAVTAAGCLPYWSELPSLDMLGLNDHYLPRHRPKDFGRGALGHELGDGAYVLGRRPDIVCFHLGNYKAWFRSGREMQQTREFYERYTPVRVRGRYPYPFDATLWIAKHSPKIGIKRMPDEIRIPGYLLRGPSGELAHLNHAGRLVRPVAAGRPAGVVIDSVRHASWKIEIRGSGPGGIWGHWEQRGDSLALGLVSSDPEPTEIEEVVLRRDGRSGEDHGAFGRNAAP